MSLKVGDAAPNFTLRNTSNETVSLCDFQRKEQCCSLFFSRL